MLKTLIENKQQVVDQLLQDQAWQPASDPVSAFAATNIALCKYWGKRDQQLHLPCNSSVSVSLGDKGCTTSIVIADDAQDTVWLNDKRVTSDTAFYKKLSRYLDLFRGPKDFYFHVRTHSNIPIAAGLASSACGFAALVLALRSLFNWQLSDQQCSILARLGSGSASRSIWPGFVEWQRGERADGMDSHGMPLPVNWPEFSIGLLVLSETQKTIGSRDAMQRTVETSSLFSIWPERAETDCQAIRQAVLRKDFERVASTAEANALLMHASMHAAKPPVNYWLAESIAAMQQVWFLRRNGIPVYFTMDAGPNVKLLYPASYLPQVQQAFPALMPINRAAVDKK